MKKFRYAINGLISALGSEVNMRIHIIAAVLACIAGFYFSLTLTEWIVIILCIVLVISFELINTAIEELCNMVHPEQHPVIKKVKDIAAAAVLVAATGSVVAALIIFLPKLISLFSA
ncbi:diacylglycerol kinase family protein [Lacibacter sp. H375]|uniref:diacylglycerol kinase family protein n=1 Tax=Lacibacter sp. H375 TaxID=3133424 RepID=UPI0030C4DBF8